MPETPAPSPRELLERAIEYLIAFLDVIDPDPDPDLEDGGDVEPDEDGEPSLASTASINQQHWASGAGDDREDEHDGREPEHEDGGQWGIEAGDQHWLIEQRRHLYGRPRKRKPSLKALRAMLASKAAPELRRCEAAMSRTITDLCSAWYAADHRLHTIGISCNEWERANKEPDDLDDIFQAAVDATDAEIDTIFGKLKRAKAATTADALALLDLSISILEDDAGDPDRAFLMVKKARAVFAGLIDRPHRPR